MADLGECNSKTELKTHFRLQPNFFYGERHGSREFSVISEDSQSMMMMM